MYWEKQMNKKSLIEDSGNSATKMNGTRLSATEAADAVNSSNGHAKVN